MNWSDFFPKLNKGAKIDFVPSIEQQRQIPRIIHQVYFSDKPMSAELAANLENLKRRNPGWEHRLYDDRGMRDYVAQNFGPPVVEHYDRLNTAYGAALTDFFRYLLLYKSGGLYLDIKSSARRPLDEVLRPDDSFVLSQWRNGHDDPFRGWGIHPEIQHINGGEFQQWHIAAAPGHPFLKAVVENVIRNIDVYNPAIHGTGQLGVLRVTGPIAYTLAIAPLLDRHPYRIADASADLGLSYSIFEGERHASLFKEHYSSLNEPVVTLSPFRKKTAAVLETLRTLARKARALARPRS